MLVERVLPIAIQRLNTFRLVPCSQTQQNSYVTRTKPFWLFAILTE